MDSVCYLTKL
uniref:Uncharacterized protein n=1 Tax=Rhizophora mucronata TaxID=61149 RepID=A0A2P2R1I9_RHIMU